MGAGERWHHEVTGYEAEVRRYVKMVTSCHIFRVVVVLCCGLVLWSCVVFLLWCFHLALVCLCVLHAGALQTGEQKIFAGRTT